MGDNKNLTVLLEEKIKMKERSQSISISAPKMTEAEKFRGVIRTLKLIQKDIEICTGPFGRNPAFIIDYTAALIELAEHKKRLPYHIKSDRSRILYEGKPVVFALEKLADDFYVLWDLHPGVALDYEFARDIFGAKAMRIGNCRCAVLVKGIKRIMPDLLLLELPSNEQKLLDNFVADERKECYSGEIPRGSAIKAYEYDFFLRSVLCEPQARSLVIKAVDAPVVGGLYAIEIPKIREEASVGRYLEELELARARAREQYMFTEFKDLSGKKLLITGNAHRPGFLALSKNYVAPPQA